MLRTRSLWLVATALTLSLVASSCGDDAQDAAPATTAAPTTAAPTTAAPDDAPATTAAPTTAAPTTEAPDEGNGWPDKITFGFVPSQEQDTLQDDIQPFIDVLEAAIGIEVDGIVTTDYTGLVTAMGTGQADLGAFGPFGYTLAQDNFGNLEPLIQSVRFGACHLPRSMVHQ